MYRNNRHGFSMIVMVMGIVVLGLIIGGFLYGSMLSSSAHATQLISKLSKYESATVTFRQTSAQYPGDSASFSPPGDGNGILNDQLGACARAPDDKLINDEKYQFWAQLSQSKILADEEFKSFSPVLCGGTDDNNWAAPRHAGILWPYMELNPKAAALYGAENGDKSPIWADNNEGKAGVHFTFYLDAEAVDPFTHKLEKDETAISQVEVSNVYGDDKCKTSGVSVAGQPIDEFISCKDENAALAKFNYFVRN